MKRVHIVGVYGEQFKEALRQLGIEPRLVMEDNITRPLKLAGDYMESGGYYIFLVPDDFSPLKIKSDRGVVIVGEDGVILLRQPKEKE